MSRMVLLDTSLLGMVTHPRENLVAKDWLKGILQAGVQVRVPEIADYELRRELLRANKVKSIQRLDRFKKTIGYVPLNTSMMLKAAEFWARARNQGRPTAEEAALDGDMILTAQAAVLAVEGNEVVIATTNVGHLSLFADARRWQDIGSAWNPATSI